MKTCVRECMHARMHPRPHALPRSLHAPQQALPTPPHTRTRRYEDYLDHQITATDMFYLEDVELARHLVELG